MTNRCAGLGSRARAAVIPAPRLYSVILKTTGAPEILKFGAEGGPISLVANSRAPRSVTQTSATDNHGLRTGAGFRCC